MINWNKVEENVRSCEYFYYIPFVLGYDLLHDYFANSEDKESDIVYEKCIEITKDYLKSEEHKDYKKSEYDALTEYLRNRNYIK